MVGLRNQGERKQSGRYTPTVSLTLGHSEKENLKRTLLFSFILERVTNQCCTPLECTLALLFTQLTSGYHFLLHKHGISTTFASIVAALNRHIWAGYRENNLKLKKQLPRVRDSLFGATSKLPSRTGHIGK